MLLYDNEVQHAFRFECTSFTDLSHIVGLYQVVVFTYNRHYVPHDPGQINHTCRGARMWVPTCSSHVRVT